MPSTPAVVTRFPAAPRTPNRETQPSAKQAAVQDALDTRVYADPRGAPSAALRALTIIENSQPVQKKPGWIRRVKKHFRPDKPIDPTLAQVQKMESELRLVNKMIQEYSSAAAEFLELSRQCKLKGDKLNAAKNFESYQQAQNSALAQSEVRRKLTKMQQSLATEAQNARFANVVSSATEHLTSLQDNGESVLEQHARVEEAVRITARDVEAVANSRANVSEDFEAFWHTGNAEPVHLDLPPAEIFEEEAMQVGTMSN